MRKFLHILGALTLIVILASGIGLGTLLYKGHALDLESKAFVDSAVPTIAATWNKQEFLDRAAPELRERVKLEELNSLFDRFSQLGPLVRYEGATGRAGMSYMTGAGSTVSASYVAMAHCQNGNVTFRIGLLKRDGRWMVRDFRVTGSQTRRGV